MNRVLARVIGQMPFYGKVADALWGEDADIDSDGDSGAPESTDWRELTLILRPGYDHRIDIDPIPDDRDVIELRSESLELLDQALLFLEDCGSVARIDSESRL